MQLMLVLFGLITLALAFRLWDRDTSPTPSRVATGDSPDPGHPGG